MKQDSADAKNLKPLLQQLETRYKPEDPAASEPVTQLVIGMLQWEATRKQAEQAFSKLMNELVDINEIRVSQDYELVSLIGQNYPRVDERVARLRETLNAIFVKEHGVVMSSIVNSGKKEQRAYLDALPGVPPYAAAQVMLLSFGGHALPVDEKLVSLLAQEQVVSADTPPGKAEGSLLRQVKAADTLHAHTLLQAWADDHKPGKGGARPAKKKKVASRKTSAARSGGASKSTSRGRK